jgi:SAM-dependent methyltransferase
MIEITPVLTRLAGPNWEADVDLRRFLPTVDTWFASGVEQHPMRRWEYAMALLARACWYAHLAWLPDMPSKLPGSSPKFLDVGGAGSPLHRMLDPTGGEVYIVDPKFHMTIEQAKFSAGAIFSISVIEHVDDVTAFLEACARNLVHHGLLFLTMDAWDPPVDQEHAPDTAHFHWMRKRIFNPRTVGHLMDELQPLGFVPFGGVDLEYKGNTVYDYTFASLCMVKENR